MGSLPVKNPSFSFQLLGKLLKKIVESSLSFKDLNDKDSKLSDISTTAKNIYSQMRSHFTTKKLKGAVLNNR